MIKGASFDATNLPKLLNQQGKGNNFKKINTNIEIDFIIFRPHFRKSLKISD